MHGKIISAIIHNLKAIAFGMGCGILISLLIDFLFDNYPFGLIFGLSIGLVITFKKLKNPLSHETS